MQNTGKAPVCELYSSLKSLLHSPSNTTPHTSMFAVTKYLNRSSLKGGVYFDLTFQGIQSIMVGKTRPATDAVRSTAVGQGLYIWPLMHKHGFPRQQLGAPRTDAPKMKVKTVW